MSEALQEIQEVKPRRFRPYPDYKDSGVEWLGEIPAHWEAKKVKRLCLVRRGASPRPIEDPIYTQFVLNRIATFLNTEAGDPPSPCTSSGREWNRPKKATWRGGVYKDEVSILGWT